MSSDSLRAPSPFIAFDSETGSRRPRWIALLAGVLAIVFIVTGVGVGLGAANAHTPTVKVDCYGLTVKLQSYNNSGGGTNSLLIIVNGVEKVNTANFGTSFPETTYAFADPSATDNTYTVKVVAHDGTSTNGYNVDQSGTAPTCDAPDATLTATECNTIDGTTTVTATFSKLLGGLTYSAQLFANDVPFGAAFAPSTASPSIWTDMAAGVTYKLTVTSTQYSGLTVTKQTAVVGCPQNSALVVEVTECTSPTSANASVLVTASQLVVGRTYTATVFQGSTAITGAIPVTQGSSTSVAFSIPIPPSTSGLTVVLTDTLAATTVTSSTFATKACPTDPGAPTVTTTVCTAVGADSDLTVTVSLTGLTVGRVYLIQVDGSQVAEITAAGTSEGGLVYSVAPGLHTVTIVDKLVPSLTKTSDPIEVTACPTQPDITFSVTECDAAGGKGEITATFTGLGALREYLVTITENGNAVPGYETAATVTSASGSLTYLDLSPAKTYTVTIVDKLATAVKDAASIYLEQCPMTPELELTLECLLFDGDSLITATIADLAPGEEYEVTITDDSTATPVALGGLGGGTAVTVAAAPVDSTTVTGATDPTTVTFQVPNDVNYTVTVTKVTNTKVTNSAQIFAAICDLPTFSLPPELPTLALTGAGDTTMPMLGALGLVQFGVALLALAAMLQFAPRRRFV